MTQEVLLERVTALCMALPGCTEDLPFDDRTLVFKVGGKMFCLLDVIAFQGCALKASPDDIPELRAQHAGVRIGPYMNGKHWNYVFPEPWGDVPWNVFAEMVATSHALVFKGLTKKKQAAVTSGMG